MERKPLPKDLRDKLNRLRLPTMKELNVLLKRLTPAQRQMLDRRISDASANFRKSQFKLVFGGRRRPEHSELEQRATWETPWQTTMNTG